MLAARRQSSHTSLAPLSPGASLPRPHSVAGQTSLSRLANSSGSEGDQPESRNVRVVLRIRPSDHDSTVPPRFQRTIVHPTNPGEVRVDVDAATLAGHGAGSLGAGKRHPSFGFDHVLGEEASQVDLYDVTGKEVIDEFLRGHNVTFLAYGQTSSGKSYSMGTTGEDTDYSGTRFNDRTGLIPRTVQTIFDRVEQIRLESGPSATWECRLSFLELYNEEIIDLLSGSSLSITIREERDGRILWAGVREIKVKTLPDVMALLQDGSARRKTGETTMNATSSRSHAIFSLTLVQRKRAALVHPTESPPRAASSTGLRRPSSTLGLNSPRSPTPSGSRMAPPTSYHSPLKPAMLPRPNSMQIAPVEDEEYVITTSKFNMVDLAGSERLKRTAAQGERMKEGIAINSGLLALGNVISILADPIKARGHIPYRDSKLTRMLQDSIGGNALTTMIACVSGIEYNIGETLNTIKYASRARNIRNAAKINQVEAGWDDIEHLQSTVLKLRKQLAVLDANGTLSPAESEEGRMQTAKLVQRLADLQREHTELYDQYLGKCSENMRLASEFRNAPSGDGEASTTFNQTVEPVILEYEKVIVVLNRQLEELRGEATMLNEMFGDQGRELEEAQTKQEQSDLYVQELRSRLSKSSERNSAGEGHIHDLENKLKTQMEQDDSRSKTVTELRKTIADSKAEKIELQRRAAELTTQLELEKAQNGPSTRGQSERANHGTILNGLDGENLLRQLKASYERIEQLESKLAAEDESRSLAADGPRSASGDHEVISDQSEPALNVKGMQRHSLSTQDGTMSPPATPDLTTDSSTESDVDPDAIRALQATLQGMTSRAFTAEKRVEDLLAQLAEERDRLPPMPSPNGSDHSNGDNTSVETPTGSPLKAASSNNNIATKGRDFRGGRGYGGRRLKPQSLSQELSSAQSLPLSQRTSWAPHSPTTLLKVLPTRPSSVAGSTTLRSVGSLEAELKFLHKVVEQRDEDLNDKEAYIHKLEDTLRQSHNIPSLENSANHRPHSPTPADFPLPPSSPPSPHTIQRLAPPSVPQTAPSSPRSARTFGHPDRHSSATSQGSAHDSDQLVYTKHVDSPLLSNMTNGANEDQIAKQQDIHDLALAELHASHKDILLSLQTEHDHLIADLEGSLSASDESRRQNKIKLDQAQFELSRVRDEHELARAMDMKRVNELSLHINKLQKSHADLEATNAELRKQLLEMSSRHENGPPLPPQGPAPTIPLPQIPTSPLRTSGTSSAGDGSGTARNDGDRARIESASRDLAEARKLNSKLRAHLEDARQESRRVSDACSSHMSELTGYRETMSKLSEDSTHQRDSLLAANAQVATLKAQLDRAVDAKVSKKLSQRLKCF